MDEIGGYIELDRSNGIEYHNEAIALNSGRHCLEYIVRVRGISRIHLPFYLCDSVREILIKLGVKISHYHIDESFNPIFDKKLERDEFLYIVNYFGQLENEKIIEYKKKYVNIIVDNAQAFFETPIAHTDTLYTCRKFFGVSDGAYLYTESHLNIDLEFDKSYDRIHYVLGRFELDANTFFAEASKNNDAFTKEPLKRMSKLTRNILKTVDYGFVKNQRETNFIYLNSGLEKMNCISVSVPKGSFMYPFLSNTGERIKKRFISEKVYIPTLWREVLKFNEISCWETELVKNLVLLPCDQRYTTKEMQKLIELI